jgi:beta-lactamase class D
MNSTQIFHKALIGIFCLIFISACKQPENAPKWTEMPDWGNYFKDAGVNGTFLLYEPTSMEYKVWNSERARTGFLPASTFKIFNSLVILETGQMPDIDTFFPWDSVERAYSFWNQDQNIRTGMKYSAVWFYQEMARRIGEDTMQAYVDRVGYGNQDISGGIDLFWLQGGLKMTALEQVQFVERLYNNDLPFSQRTMDGVKESMINEENEEFILRAKTGWAIRTEPGTGWWVGYVERGEKVYYFAMNIDTYKSEDAEARKSVSKQILRAEGIL